MFCKRAIMIQFKKTFHHLLVYVEENNEILHDEHKMPGNNYHTTPRNAQISIIGLQGL
jgi:hypothetical protein